jgi:monolysocardiolipin acyltransferase
MRYFKWGVARLILESEPCPDVVPIWVDGFQDCMDSRRTFPKPVPRPGKDIGVWFGERVDVELVFEPFRERWRQLKDRTRRRSFATDPAAAQEWQEHLGMLHDDELKYGDEAKQLRIDVTLAVRDEVLKVRKLSGLPDDDPKSGLAETWREEGSQGKVEGEMKDRSVVKDL